MPIKGSQRNKPCLCGSGKYFKKCCMGKKPRKSSVLMDMGKPKVVNKIRISPNGVLELLKDNEVLIPENARFETTYDRDTKTPKVLHSIPQNQRDITLKPYITLKKYDLIFAIDTNTKKIKDNTISVSCVVLCKLDYTSENKIDIKYAPIECFEFRNIKQKHENVAWVKAIERITNNPANNKKTKIGLVVDSDLGNIPAYNNRKMPIYSDFYLPANIELLHASSDAGKEFVLNRIISLCDREAKKLLKKLEKHITNKDLQKVSDKPYTHFRSWR